MASRFIKHSQGSTRILMTLGVVAVALESAGRVHADGSDGSVAPAPLKWTPHRAATAVRPERDGLPEAPPAASTDARVTAPAAETAAAEQSGPGAASVGPPASVSLPPSVPSLTTSGPRPRDSFAPLRTRPGEALPDWSNVARLPDRLQQAFDPGNLGSPKLRTPQPPSARTAARDPGRPERLAMNVDGIPSVMTQAPQVGALDDARVPGRSPGTPRNAGPLSAPPADVPGDMSLDGEPTIIDIMPGMPGDALPGSDGMAMGEGDDLLLGGLPTQMHVESFYDDPYACEDDECGQPLCQHHGAICNWLRQFGRPYYGWHWYRDFTASGGVTAFENETNFGLRGNFGTNEYLNWAMPFWNAFGIGWQVGARGVQTNFQPTTVTTASGGRLQNNARDQTFVTTGFFTRAFEGRGLQGGAAYDYLSDNWYDTSDVVQIRSEISYVWGYHEFGYWGAHNIGDQSTIFGPIRRTPGVAGTLDLYCGFYRLQFGDANEWKVWGGGVDGGGGIVGSMLRAPIARSWALEGTFTYVIPEKSKTVTIDEQGTSVTFSPSAWNLGINLVYYPAGRSRRSLASPYRPLFDVADNGSMIRTVTSTTSP